MRRFDEALTLDHLADQGRIDAALADRLGRIVAAGHAQAAPVAPQPWIEAMGAYIGGACGASSARRPSCSRPPQVAAWGSASRAAYARIRPLLIERGARGLIRRIHGDLHLGNIALIDGAPVLFDAIEFSPLIGSGDVLYDLAFLLMDLIERGLPQPANVVFNRYLAQTRRAEDFDALAALPFYPLDAGRDPRQGDGRAARACGARRSRPRSARARAAISIWRGAPSRPRPP